SFSSRILSNLRSRHASKASKRSTQRARIDVREQRMRAAAEAVGSRCSRAPLWYQRCSMPPHEEHESYKDAAKAFEAAWRARWEARGTYVVPNPGEPGFDATRPKLVVLDFFPYPSGTGLHIGHPRGYLATDVYVRFQKMRGKNVLYSMGFDSFGLPAEQYAIQTGQHPSVTTEVNKTNMLRQLEYLGVAHDPTRRFCTTDPAYFKWTQWIFHRLFNSYYDPTHAWTDAAGRAVAGRARPITEL